MVDPLPLEDQKLTQRMFDELVEDIVWELDISHFEAVLEYCKRFDLEPEEISRYVSKPLREKIEADAIAEGHLPRPAELQF